MAPPDVAELEAAIGPERGRSGIVSGLMSCVFGSILIGSMALLDRGIYLPLAIGIRRLSFPASAMAIVLCLTSNLVAMSRGTSPGVVGLNSPAICR